MRVVFTPLAARNIDELHEYITAHSSEERADGYINRIVVFCNGLETFPYEEGRATTFCPACE
jgi:plasmid stabilization system protein ParE